MFEHVLTITLLLLINPLTKDRITGATLGGDMVQGRKAEGLFTGQQSQY